MSSVKCYGQAKIPKKSFSPDTCRLEQLLLSRGFECVKQGQHGRKAPGSTFTHRVKTSGIAGKSAYAKNVNIRRVLHFEGSKHEKLIPQWDTNTTMGY